MGSPGRALRHQRPQATQLAPRLGASPAPVPTLAAAQPAPASHSSGRSAALGRSAAAPLAGRNAEPGRGALQWTQLGSRSRLESRFSTCESLPPASVRGFARSRPGNGTHLRRRVPRALLGELLCRPKLLLQRRRSRLLHQCARARGRGALQTPRATAPGAAGQEAAGAGPGEPPPSLSLEQAAAAQPPARSLRLQPRLRSALRPAARTHTR
jgi:hypothetical protein